MLLDSHSRQQPGCTRSPGKVIVSSIASCNILDYLRQTLPESLWDGSGTGWEVQVLAFPLLRVCYDGQKKLDFGI